MAIVPHFIENSRIVFDKMHVKSNENCKRLINNGLKCYSNLRLKANIPFLFSSISESAPKL